MSADTHPTTAQHAPSSPDTQGVSDSAATPVEALSWQRIRLFRCFSYLMIPVSILSFISGSLWLAIHFAGPANFQPIQFWFYFFDVGREINVPTWFSAGMWIIAATFAGYFARHATRHCKSWLLFSVVCIVFSLDETLELHERLDVIGNEISKHLPIDLGFTWVIPGTLIAVLIVALLLRLVVALPRGTRRGLITAGAVFVAGAIGVETLSGLFIQDNGLPWQFFLLTLIEETLEMTGIALCVAALANLVAYRHGDRGAIVYRVADTAIIEVPASAKYY